MQRKQQRKRKTVNLCFFVTGYKSISTLFHKSCLLVYKKKWTLRAVCTFRISVLCSSKTLYILEVQLYKPTPLCFDQKWGYSILPLLFQTVKPSLKRDYSERSRIWYMSIIFGIKPKQIN